MPTRFCRHPPTPPAPSALRPLPGGAGAVLTISGEQPYPGWSRRAAVHWTVGISRLGERLTGRGNSFPLPCLPRSSYLTSHRPPSRAFAGIPVHSLPAAPTPPAPSQRDTQTLLPAPPLPAPAALLPRPLSEQGSARAYIRRAAVPGFSPGSPCAPDHGGYRHGGDDSCKD